MKISIDTHMKYFLFLITLSLILGSGRSSAQSAKNPHRVYELSRIWKDMSENFHDPHVLKTIGWDSIYCDYISKVQEVKSDKEYYFLLQKFMACGNDGHTELVSLGRYNFNYPTTGALPVDGIWVGSKFHIYLIDTGTIKNIPLGSEIVKINGQSTLAYFQEHIFPYVSAKTLQDKKKKSCMFFPAGNAGDSLALTIRTDKKTKKTTDIQVAYKPIAEIDRRNFIQIPGIGGSQTDSYLVPDSLYPYYYLRLDQFDSGFNMRKWMSDAKERSGEAKYVILDLRNNVGGSELKADSLLMSFLDIDTLRTYPSLIRQHQAYFCAQGFSGNAGKVNKEYYEGLHCDTIPAETLAKENLPFIDKPLYVLISGTTASAAEDFLIALKLHHPDRAVLVGTPTAATTGAPLVRELSEGMYYRICTRRPLLPDGMFDQGIQPDAKYEPVIEDYMEGPDGVYDFVKSLYVKSLKNKAAN